MSTPSMTQRRLDRLYARQQSQFDAITPQSAVAQIAADPLSERMAIAVTSQMRLQALTVIFTLAGILADTNYDEDEMLPSEALDSLMLAAFSEDDDDDDDDINENVKDTFAAHVADAFSTLGVEDSVIDDLFDTDVEVADAAVQSACDTVLENMPDDGDPFQEFLAGFVYGDDDDYDDETAFDDMNGEPQFDATGTPKNKLRPGKKTTKKVGGKTLVYKAVRAIRHGKKVTINKRISGKPLLKASQRAALNKARRKAGTASAIKKQIRSFNKGVSMNIYKSSPKRLAAIGRANSVRHFNNS